LPAIFSLKFKRSWDKKNNKILESKHNERPNNWFQLFLTPL
jgi:hypothetical protein